MKPKKANRANRAMSTPPPPSFSLVESSLVDARSDCCIA